MRDYMSQITPFRVRIYLIFFPHCDRSLPDNVSPHYVDLKRTIDEQKERIQRLEDREIDCQEELKRREQLILDLQHEMIALQHSYDASNRELRTFTQYIDEAQRHLLAETDKIRSLILKSTKTISTLEKAFLDISHATSDQLDGKYFNTLELSAAADASSNLPVLTIQKIYCPSVSLLSPDPLSSISPYIVVSLGDQCAQTGPIVETRSGGPLEWKPSNQILQLVTSISTEDLVTVEIWNQFSLHEAHLIATATGKLISTEVAARDWQTGNDCDSEITLRLFDDKANPLDQTITLVGHLKNNLYRRPSSPGPYSGLGANPHFEQGDEEEMSKYLKSLEVSIPNSEVEQVEISLASSFSSTSQSQSVDAYLASWRLIMKALISAEFECGTAIKSSDALMSSQSSVSHNLLNSIQICNEQSDGMRNYALSLQPLVEKLRTERSYKDLLQESETKYESELSLLRQQCAESEDLWRLKYSELESSSQLRFDQYVGESQSRYTTLLESSNKAYADLREAYETSRLLTKELSDRNHHQP
jgi:hypothetical protein